jgi:hypothetical protein
MSIIKQMLQCKFAVCHALSGTVFGNEIAQLISFTNSEPTSIGGEPLGS